MTNSTDTPEAGAKGAKPSGIEKNGLPWLGAIRWFLTFGLPMYAIVGALLFIAGTAIWGVGKKALTGEEHAVVSPQTAGGRQDVAAPSARPSAASSAVPLEGGAPVANQLEPSKASELAAQQTPPTGTATPVAIIGAGAATQSSTALSSEISSFSTVAKLALDTTKERVDGMKDTYDRLFAMIAALGALLAFLGFKGFESFTLAKKNAADVVEKAELAVAKANAANERAEYAKQQVDDAVKKLNFFIDVEYPRNNVAEIEVARGIIMREIAGVYQAVAKRCGQDIKDYPEFRKTIDLGLIYLKRAVAAPERLDPETVSRALITMGNLNRRMSNIHGAVEACQRVVDEFSPNDSIAHYNLACYYCLLAENEEKTGGPAFQVQSYAASAIASLERAIELDASNRADARDDDDFAWFQQHPAFKALVAIGTSPTQSPKPCEGSVA